MLGRISNNCATRPVATSTGNSSASSNFECQRLLLNKLTAREIQDGFFCRELGVEVVTRPEVDPTVAEDILNRDGRDDTFDQALLGRTRIET